MSAGPRRPAAPPPYGRAWPNASPFVGCRDPVALRVGARVATACEGRKRCDPDAAGGAPWAQTMEAEVPVGKERGPSR